MSDGPDLPGWHLRVFDYIGLGFLLLVAELLLQHPKVWYSWSGALVIGVICLWLGETAPTKWKKLQVRWRTPKALTLALAENALLKQQIEMANSSAQSSRMATSRLKILEARYGVEGGPDADVAEKYLIPRIAGDSLVGWVGADLFGAFQPVINLHKRLKIRYSFDGSESTVERPEHAMLVLPEDRFLKSQTEDLRKILDAEVVITGLHPNDPRIEPTFVDGRKSPLGGNEHFELKNKGKSDAYWVRIAPLRLKNQVVYFPDISELIAPTDFRVFNADIGNNFGYDRHHMFINAFNAEWAQYEDSSTRREILIPARIDFENNDGVRFECNFTILYHGGRGWNQPSDFKCVECRDITYRRIPKGIII